MGWILTLYVVNVLLIVIVVLREARRPGVGLISIVIVALIPILGFAIYWMVFSPLSVSRSRNPVVPHGDAPKPLPDTFSSSAHAIAHGLWQHAVSPLREDHVEVLKNGQETFETITQVLRNAKRSIDMEYYIYRNDPLGQLIIDILVERALGGVHVRFLRDGVGGRELTRHHIRQMREAGIECRMLYPLRFRLLPTVNYRDHCKIVIVDDHESFTGGINVGIEYLGLAPETGFWRDTHLQITGRTALDLKAVFDAHWQIATPDFIAHFTHQRDEVVRRTVRNQPFASSRFAEEFGSELGCDNDVSRETLNRDLGRDGVECVLYPSHDARKDPSHPAFLQTIEGSPSIATQRIREAYFVALTSSARSIDIATPYFLPDADIVMALKTAVARGVRVRLLLPTKLDQKVVLYASRTYYGELLEAGVEIHLYQRGIMHAKVTIVDEETAIVGAANYDARSFRLNYEICEVMYSRDVAGELSVQFAEDLADSIRLVQAELSHRGLVTRLLDQGARVLSPLL